MGAFSYDGAQFELDDPLPGHLQVIIGTEPQGPTETVRPLLPCQGDG